MEALQFQATLIALLSGVTAPAVGAAMAGLGESPALPDVPIEEQFDPEPIVELDEVLVSGARRNRSSQALLNWLKRLPGEFAYEGNVELISETAAVTEESIRGAGKCVIVGRDPTPAVQCAAHVVWPEIRSMSGAELPRGASTLAPSMTMYGIDLNYLGIRYLQVDSRGLAEGGLGYLRGNTLTTTTPCVDMPGECRRTSRITAQPDGRRIQMQIDIEQDGRQVARYTFMLRRLVGAPDDQSAQAGERH